MRAHFTACPWPKVCNAESNVRHILLRASAPPRMMPILKRVRFLTCPRRKLRNAGSSVRNMLPRPRPHG
eukprot:10233033-Prorocentrum_lima.AAC.1